MAKSDGRFTTWAIVVLLTWVFNSEGITIHHPLQALGQFLRIYSTFEWDKKAVTVYGPVDASENIGNDFSSNNIFIFHIIVNINLG